MNIYEYVRKHKTAEGFTPSGPCMPTTNPPGSLEKIAEMEERVAQGLNLWHADDVPDCNGLAPGAMQPRHGTFVSIKVWW